MKLSFRTFLQLVILALVFASCKKDQDLVKPVPQKPAGVHSFQLNFEPIPGETEVSLRNHSVIITIVNNNNETVVDKRKLPLSFDGKLKTAEISLAAGNYRVSACWIVNENNQARFASPLINSANAVKVSKPLPVGFILPAPAVLQVPLEVAKIETGDTPEKFGYPAGSFSTIPGSDDEESPTIFVRLRLAIRVGEVNYDNLQAGIAYTSWDEQQNAVTKYISIKPEDNSVMLVRKAVKHHLRINKWGQTYELYLAKDEVKEGETYNMGGTKHAKMLRNEIEYRLINGAYVPDSKTSFYYLENGKLSGIEYYFKASDGKPYLAMKDLFKFTGSRLGAVERLDAKGKVNSTTNISYNSTGRISDFVVKTDNATTRAGVTYYTSPATGITEVMTKYEYSTHGMQYFQRYLMGNLVSDNSHTDNYSTESGEYTYDNNINPYIHMGWPDLYHGKNSRNNLVNQQKTYSGTYPDAVAYEFIYKYDSEGYPTELIRHYKSYLTKQFVYTTKTVFTY